MVRSYQYTILIFFYLVLFSCTHKDPIHISITRNSDALTSLAAKELRRYLYLRTGELPLIDTVDTPRNLQKKSILVCSPDFIVGEISENDSFQKVLLGLKDESILIESLNLENLEVLLITGGGKKGPLYACYRFLESLGIRFYPHGDVLPDDKLKWKFPVLHIYETPVFSKRGIQPFHDFPEGPDWWTEEDYKSILTQLAKMRMNFIGFHTYPSLPYTGWAKPEPMVWIGLQEGFNPDGTVRTAYPVMHSNTQDCTWGYWSKKTSEFSFGASMLFETDFFGPYYMQNIGPWPHTDMENIKIFNDFGKIQKDVFRYARSLGIYTCLGTETPLTIPESVKGPLKLEGIEPESEEARKLVYKGTFSRIMSLHPLDYYWFWTPEGWTWNEVSGTDVWLTQRDLLLAVEAAKEVDAPFTLATCGWVLGPPGNRTLFDRILPKEMPFSCINRYVGFTPVEEGFSNIQGRSKWAIPWLEDDPALISPQLWVGRIRKDAYDALKYGCDGFLGIHWRTSIISPALGALAQAGWDTSWMDLQPNDTARNFTSIDFYTDWCKAQFGKEVSEDAALLFSQIDGGKGVYHGNLFRTSHWAKTGPGAVYVNKDPWGKVKLNFNIIDEFEKLEGKIKGKGNKERYQYWLNTFYYTRAMAQTGCLLGQLDKKVEEIQLLKSGDVKQKIKDEILPLRDSIEDAWKEMINHLLAMVETSGEMGMIANLEMHSMGQLNLLAKHDHYLDSLLGGELKPIAFTKEYSGESRIILPTKRSVLGGQEDLNLKIIVLSTEAPQSVIIRWKPLEGDKFQEKNCTHISRGIYSVQLSRQEYNYKDFEYSIQVKAGLKQLVYPSTAPERNATVVVSDSML